MPKPYSQLARWYDQMYSSAFYSDYGAFIKRVSGQYGITRIRVLDVACGTGRLLAELLPGAVFVAGLDNSKEMLNQARKLLPKAKFYQQNLQSIEVDEKYNLITCTFDSINYILNLTDVIKVFRRISRSLDSGGIFVFDFNTTHKQLSGTTSRGKVIYQDRIDGPFWIIDIETPDGKEQHRERLYTPEEIKIALEKSGMHIISTYSDFRTKAAESSHQRLIVVAQKGDN